MKPIEAHRGPSITSKAKEVSQTVSQFTKGVAEKVKANPQQAAADVALGVGIALNATGNMEAPKNPFKAPDSGFIQNMPSGMPSQENFNQQFTVKQGPFENPMAARSAEAAEIDLATTFKDSILTDQEAKGQTEKIIIHGMYAETDDAGQLKRIHTVVGQQGQSDTRTYARQSRRDNGTFGPFQKVADVPFHATSIGADGDKIIIGGKASALDSTATAYLSTDDGKTFKKVNGLSKQGEVKQIEPQANSEHMLLNIPGRDGTLVSVNVTTGIAHELQWDASLRTSETMVSIPLSSTANRTTAEQHVVTTYTAREGDSNQGLLQITANLDTLQASAVPVHPEIGRVSAIAVDSQTGDMYTSNNAVETIFRFKPNSTVEAQPISFSGVMTSLPGYDGGAVIGSLHITGDHMVAGASYLNNGKTEAVILSWPKNINPNTEPNKVQKSLVGIANSGLHEQRRVQVAGVGDKTVVVAQVYNSGALSVVEKRSTGIIDSTKSFLGKGLTGFRSFLPGIYRANQGA